MSKTVQDKAMVTTEHK